MINRIQSITLLSRCISFSKKTSTIVLLGIIIIVASLLLVLPLLQLLLYCLYNLLPIAVYHRQQIHHYQQHSQQKCQTVTLEHLMSHSVLLVAHEER